MTSPDSYVISFPVELAIDPTGDHFRTCMLPEFHKLLNRAGFSLAFIKHDPDSFLNQMRDSLRNLKIVFDMSQIKFIGLSEVLETCVMGSALNVMTGSPVLVIPPKHIRSSLFLLEVGFYRDAFRWGTLPKGGESVIQNLLSTKCDSPSEFLLPLTRIDLHPDVRDASHAVGDTRNNIEILLKNAWAQEDDAELQYAIEELSGTLVGEPGENICKWSESKGYVAVLVQPSSIGQQERGPFSHPNVVVAISDGGIGIVRSLVKKDPAKYESLNPERVIEMVIQGDIPQNPGQTRGGIKRAHNLIRDLFHGEMHIKTMFTEYSKWYNYSNPIGFRRSSDKQFFIGTHVVMKLPRFFGGGIVTEHR